MLSHSAVVKLKAILIIDLIIVGAAAGTYFYLHDEGMVAAKQAKFTLTDLTIDPQQVYTDDPVQISVNVTNIGDLQGNQTVNFEINNALKDFEEVTLAGNSSQIVQFIDNETAAGFYNVTVGALNGNFTVIPLPPESSKIVLSNLVVATYEVWVNQTVTVTATAKNPSTDPDTISAKLTVDNKALQTEIISLNGSSTQTIQFTFNATSEGKHTINVNALVATFSVVKTGYHTLEIARSGGGSTPLVFTLNGTSYSTPCIQLLPVGHYVIDCPDPYNTGKAILSFTSWNDGSTSATRTINFDSWLILVATYTLVSGSASCPSLFIWNGTGYSYVTDVANAGWLGYMGTMTSTGNIIYSGGNPWDYVKLNNKLLTPKIIGGTSYFDMTLSQQWDELFYLDNAYMLVVDHPVGTDVYSTMSNYANPSFNDQIYTVNQKNILSPVSATYVWGPAGTTAKGQNVLAQISSLDGKFTPGNNGLLSPAWNNVNLNQLTLDLGNLSNAQQIKLIVNGMVDWGDPGPYYSWISAFQAAAAKGLIPANGSVIYPAPYMEIKDAKGNWVPVSQSEMPTPSDFNSRNFVVDLTGAFPKGLSDYQIRICNFFNVTFDYVGIDVSTQQHIAVQKISPTATLSQFWSTNSTSSGNFTRYGDVTALVQNADNMYVIGRQGDEVTLDFPTANLSAPAPGMVRDYFFIVACWFKDPPGNWGYGFSFTVDPLPFIGMSGFPYTADETYPFDAAHLAYLAQYNTRVIPPS